MEDDDPAAASGLTFSGGKRSRARSNSMACFLKSNSTSSENSDKLHAVHSRKGGLVKLAVSGLRKFRPFLKIKSALKKKPKKQQNGASISASRKQVSSGYEHELAKPHRPWLEDERDMSVETEKLSSTENAYSKAAANSCPEEDNSKEVSEPEYEQGTEMESIALGNPKLDPMHGPNNKVDEDPNDGSIVDKSQSRIDKFAETGPCHKHTNNLAMPTKLLSQLPGVTNPPNQSVKNPRIESLSTKQSYTGPAASSLDNQLDWQTDESAEVEELADELKPKDEQMKGLLTKTVDNLEPLSLEGCKNQANAESPGKTSGGKLNCQSGKSAEVKFLADWKMVRPKQTSESFYEAGDNLHEEALQEGTIEMGKKNRGVTAKTTSGLVKDSQSARQSGSPENGSAIHDFCLGIPYGCLVIAESLLWFIYTWRTSSIYSGVLLGGLILASSISSLKAWSEGCSSRTHIKAQAAIALLICAQALPDVLKTKLLFPNAIVCIISAAMVGFYAYVYYFGNNVQEEKT